MTSHPARRELRMPFTRDGLEALRASLGNLFSLPCFSGVDTGGKLLAADIAFFTCCFQSHVRINAERKPLFFPSEAILPAPPLAPSGINLQIEAATIEEFRSLFLGL